MLMSFALRQRIPFFDVLGEEIRRSPVGKPLP
jgi:hypothetical protein